MKAAELVGLVKTLIEREIDRDEDNFVGKLRQTDFREQEDLGAFQTLINVLGLDEWLEDCRFDVQTDLRKQPEEEEEEETQLDEMAEWVERLKYLNETQHRRG